MTEAERVLAELAKLLHASHVINLDMKLEELTAPYLPKPEPDRLTLAARELGMIAEAAELPAPCRWGSDAMESFNFGKKQAAVAVEKAARAIIAREVAAAEPSDEAIERVYRMHFHSDTEWHFESIRAALKGEGA